MNKQCWGLIRITLCSFWAGMCLKMALKSEVCVGERRGDPVLCPGARFSSLCLSFIRMLGGAGHEGELPLHVGDIPWWALDASGVTQPELAQAGRQQRFLLENGRWGGREVSGVAERRSLTRGSACSEWSASSMFGKRQGRDLHGFWHCWWLYKLIQVISRANLFVEKQEPTHRRAAFEFWTLNKVLSSSRTRIFSFPSPPLNTFLYLFIFSFHLLLSPFTLLDL